ncbi:unnamed protein product [Oppiella nova]|uniref:SGNH hydrolase-type esterase domain-containing protein n=1 Tax=Oppiella nova TaxID=334625 RepID=A0A7R9QR14_9ACAR|nr:unnamed protein product [Oppiella nova]CAG2172333.1 unnamed protein product [Oppiella nova]
MYKLIALTVLLSVQICLSVHPWEQEKEDGYGMGKHTEFVQYTKDNKSKIKAVFYGASICEYFGQAGQHIWAKRYEPKGAANYGIGGDTTPGMLWRFNNHELDGLKPKVFVLTSGHAENYLENNPGTSAADILKGQLETIKELRAKFPEAKVIQMGHTPYGSHLQEYNETQKVNEELKKIDDGKDVFYFDITKEMLDDQGKQIADMFQPDREHFTEKGYQVWDDAMGELFDKLMK